RFPDFRVACNQGELLIVPSLIFGQEQLPAVENSDNDCRSDAGVFHAPAVWAYHGALSIGVRGLCAACAAEAGAAVPVEKLMRHHACKGEELRFSSAQEAQPLICVIPEGFRHISRNSEIVGIVYREEKAAALSGVGQNFRHFLPGGVDDQL